MSVYGLVGMCRKNNHGEINDTGKTNKNKPRFVTGTSLVMRVDSNFSERSALVCGRRDVFEKPSKIRW